MITRELYYHHHTSNRNQFRMMCSEAEEQNIVTPTRQLSNGNVMTFGSYTRTGCPNKSGKKPKPYIAITCFCSEMLFESNIF